MYTQDSLGNPETLDEVNERGAPLRSHNKYWLRFTSDREEAFKVIHRRQMITTNPLQLFMLENFSIDKHHPSEKLSALLKSDQARANLVQYLSEKGVIDFKLEQNHEMNSILVHLVISGAENN